MLNYEENMDFLFTVGGQALTEGGGVTTGPLVAYNAETNQDDGSNLKDAISKEHYLQETFSKQIQDLEMIIPQDIHDDH